MPDRKRKSIDDMTLADFKRLPYRKWDAETHAHGFVVIPGSGAKSKLHDSGYRFITLVPFDRDQKPICRVGDGDVVHFDGIGYGYHWNERIPRGAEVRLSPRDWNMDCLPKSGLFRFWSRAGVIVGNALSSLKVYAKERDNA